MFNYLIRLLCVMWHFLSNPKHITSRIYKGTHPSNWKCSLSLLRRICPSNYINIISWPVWHKYIPVPASKAKWSWFNCGFPQTIPNLQYNSSLCFCTQTLDACIPFISWLIIHLIFKLVSQSSMVYTHLCIDPLIWTHNSYNTI